MHKSSGWGRVLGVVLLVGVAACSGDDDGGAETSAPTTAASTTAAPATSTAATTSTVAPTVPGDGPYRATITRTSYGVAHITADDFGSALFGQGYAMAEDRACTILDQIVKVRSERSRWFGPGADDANLTSDFAYLHLGIVERVEDFYATAPDATRAAVDGFSAGVNSALADLGLDGLPGWCAGEAWADRTVTPVDVLAVANATMLLASSTQFLDSIGSLQAPDGSAAEPVPAALTLPAAAAPEAVPASNGWAIGSDLSTGGGGLLLANPHFPWEGELRLWESQLTVPGELNIYGVTLTGVPGVLIGFNDAVAWTHTVSAGSRFTLYRIALDTPTTYTYGDRTEEIVPTTYRIDVRQDDGSIAPLERTLWDSQYGPMVAVGPLGWDESTAYSIRDANLDNLESIEQFLEMDQATSMDDFIDVHRRINGIPWVNTIATSADGRAWYADTAATPKLSDEAIAAWQSAVESDPVVALAHDQGAFLLDGNDPVNAWVEVPGARDPGLVPFDEQPQIERSDYVFNSNNSYWLANPAEPLTGFSPLHGGEGLPPEVRPRSNDMIIRSSAGPDGTYTNVEVGAALLSNGSLTGQQWRDAIVERCAASGRAELAAACDVLAGWDVTYHTASVGAVLWTTLLDEMYAAEPAGGWWAVPFDAADPIATPSGLNDDPAVTTAALDALGRAVGYLDSVGVALDAPLGEVQIDGRVGGSIGISGSALEDTANYSGCCADGGSTLGPKGQNGVFDGTHSVTSIGRLPVSWAGSFVMALQFGPDGPEAEAVLTYGQPDDPSNPDFTSQTELWGAETYRPVRYTEPDIKSDTVGTPKVVEAPR